MIKKLIAVVFTAIIGINGLCAQNADAEYKELVNEYMKVTNTEGTMRAMLPLMLETMKPLAPNVPESVWEKLKEKIETTGYDTMISRYTDIVAKYLSKDDLKDVIKFYKCPAGIRLANATPEIAKESLTMGQHLGVEIAMDILKELKDMGYKVNM